MSNSHNLLQYLLLHLLDTDLEKNAKIIRNSIIKEKSLLNFPLNTREINNKIKFPTSVFMQNHNFLCS